MAGVQGRVALVTGGGRGIGAAIGRRLAAGGAAVALLDLDGERAERAAADLAATGARTLGLAVDVTDADAVARGVERVVDELGGLDVAVNNAGVTRDNLLFKMSEEDWDTVMAVHLRGAFLVSRAVQGPMVAQKRGRIISLSSVSALGSRGQANYSAAKMGLQGFTRTLAVELGRFGITANAVAPGFVQSDMTDATAARLGMTPEAYREAVAERTPVGRIGQPEDIAEAVAFLASDTASYVTGQTLYVDGGQTL
ncbi:3-oxoacyl-ACP reductase FabG [uncultured Pseudokineococcus sp.]|uniref:3-oxoacyl-ACP reductase FabG n=1 Tax=uncultured Pseudokineococcus sp. TaxID=1642928 RepID=UPI00260FFAA4|nr:3-oxoacyl-ACP reductase FabG [uncultured Pseudokineococcus sp.]